MASEQDLIRMVELARVEALLNRVIWTAVAAGGGLATVTWGAVLTFLLASR